MTDTTERATALVDRIGNTPKSWVPIDWVPIDGEVTNITFLPSELELITSALRRLAVQDQEPVAFTNEYQLTHVKNPQYAGLSMAMWGKRKDASDIALYLSPPPAAGWDIPDKITPELACIMENCDGPEMQTGEAVAALVRGYQPTWTKIVAALRHTAPPDSGATKSADAGGGETLKPCPFCGSIDVVCCDQGDDDFAVTCRSCGATSPFNDVESKAIAAWNARAANASAEARLRAALERLIGSSEAFLNYFNPFNLASDKENQWHSVNEEIARAKAALSAYPQASDCDKQGCMGDVSPGDPKDLQELLNSPSVLDETTKSEGISLSDLPTGGSHSGIGFGHKTFVRKLVDDPNSASGKSLQDVEVLPSDRTADVTTSIERLQRMADSHIVDPTPLNMIGQFAATYGDLRALLDAFTVGRR